MSTLLSPLDRSRIVRVIDYASIFGVNRKTAGKMYREDCNTERVSRLTVSILAAKYHFTVNDLCAFFGFKTGKNG